MSLVDKPGLLLDGGVFVDDDEGELVGDELVRNALSVGANVIGVKVVGDGVVDRVRPAGASPERVTLQQQESGRNEDRVV